MFSLAFHLNLNDGLSTDLLVCGMRKVKENKTNHYYFSAGRLNCVKMGRTSNRSSNEDSVYDFCLVAVKLLSTIKTEIRKTLEDCSKVSVTTKDI